jgi:hypothetical protein
MKSFSSFRLTDPIFNEERKDTAISPFVETPEIKAAIAEIRDSIVQQKELAKQIHALNAEARKAIDKQIKAESKYWKEVDKQGVHPVLIAKPALTLMNKTRSAK